MALLIFFIVSDPSSGLGDQKPTVFPCSVCDRKYKSKGSRDRHFIVHTGKRDHKCHLCDKAFSLRQHLKQHMISHTRQKEFVCELCNKAFTRKDSLRFHLWTVHSSVNFDETATTEESFEVTPEVVIEKLS